MVMPLGCLDVFPSLMRIVVKPQRRHVLHQDVSKDNMYLEIPDPI
jgi:hypothetical protein